MRRCCVPGCLSNIRKPYISVFVFPKKTNLAKKWLQSIGRPDLKAHDNVGVCIKHFEKHKICGPDSKSSRKKLTLKKGAIPTIFENFSSTEDICVEGKMELLHKTSHLQKSPKADTPESDFNSSKSLGKQKFQRSPVKTRRTSSVADKPVITIIKPEDVEDSIDMSQEVVSETEDEDDEDEVDEKDDENEVDEKADELDEENKDNGKDDKKDENESDICILEEPEARNTSVLPTSFKDLPTVSVCLKAEDRVPFIRELKGIKRSSSTGSNSSVGSSETQKSVTSQKRRKIEKPAPVVIGRDNDCYCWVCHRENVHLFCIACPRAFHSKCSIPKAAINTPDWVCPECQKILAAENVDSRSSTMSEISLDKLATLLKLSLSKMKQRAPLAFHQPVSLTHYPLYLHYVIHPMDLSLLERNIKQKVYGCTEAFLADVKWLAHNSSVFNGTQHPLSTNAKNLVKSCDHDMQEIEVCPDCFIHSVVRNKYWFSEVCRKPHPLVWAKLKGFPYWPAKVVRIVDGNVDARFFGAHDRAWVPVSQCYHLSKEMPTSSKPKKKSNYEVALEELHVHVNLLVQKFGCFQYAPYRTSFNPQNIQLAYHGIDLKKACEQEETCIDITDSPIKTALPSPEKENRFAKYMNTEAEKDNSDDVLLDENQCDNSISDEKEAKSVENSKGTASKDSKIESEKTKKADLKSSFQKKSHSANDSDQLRKLELALERIKGYVSLDVDSEKEDAKSGEESEEKSKVDTDKTSPIKAIDDTLVKAKLSPLFKELFPSQNVEKAVLPNLPSTSEGSENISMALEATKKTDSFFLKLNETIQSCKAKLGISEINDDLSDNESAADENASKSDDEESSSASEADEENTSMSETENVEASDEDVIEEASDEELENPTTPNEATEKNKNRDSSEGEESGDSDNESELETSSGTDVDASKAKTSSNEKLARTKDLVEISCDDSVSPDKSNIQATKNYYKTHDVNKNPVNNDKDESKECLQEKSKQCNSASSYKSPVKISVTASKRVEDSLMEINSSTSESMTDQSFNSSSITINSNLSPLSQTSPNKFSESDSVKNAPNQLSELAKENSTLKTTDQNIVDDSDDEVIACAPPRPKTPTVIILDDDDYTSSAESPVKMAHLQSTVSNLDDKISQPAEPENTASARRPRALNGTFAKRNVEQRKRPLDSADSSDDSDDIREVSPMRKRLTGAIRTFNRNFNLPITPVITVTPKKEIVEPEKENLSPQVSPAPCDGSKSDNDTREGFSPTRNLLRNSILDTSHLGDKDKEILFLKNKLRCVLRAYHIQQWKCKQEREELRHNMNLIIMEMRTCMEADKRHAIESLSQKFQQELAKAIQETKQKQWCASCHIESRYACCWNTSYCSYICQKRHFPEHRIICTQVKNKKNETPENASVVKTNEGSDKAKKIIIVNMKKSDNSKSSDSTSANTQQVATNKSAQIQLVGSKNSLQPNSTHPCIYITPVITSNETSKSSILMPSLNQIKTVTSTTSPSSLSTSSSTISSEPTTSTLSPVTPGTISIVLAASSTSSNLGGQAGKPRILPKPAPSVFDLKSPTPVFEPQNSSASFKGLKSKKFTMKNVSLLRRKEDSSVKPVSANSETVSQKEQQALEEIYFPSPPSITFEGYDSVSPEPNLVIDDSERPDDASGDEDYEKIIPEQDITSEDEEKSDDEMVNIGYSTEVKASSLNKCQVYSTTPIKLTRCLVDVLFPDIKLRATCSAFGRKSSATKFTRCALPARKVYAIIDYVKKQFPRATRQEIIETINRKCKEARVIMGRSSIESNTEDTKEGSDQPITCRVSSSTSIHLTSSKAPQLTTIFPGKNRSPNLVSLKNSNSVQELRFPSLSSQRTVLFQANPVMQTLPPPGIVQSNTLKNVKFRRETVRELLTANARTKNLTIANMLDKVKVTTASTTSTTQSTSALPYIIIGRQSAPVIHPVVGAHTSVQK